MTRDIAIRLDGRLGAAIAGLDAIVHYMKNNLSDEEYNKLSKHIGNAMAEINDISNELYKSHPDIVPKELR